MLIPRRCIVSEMSLHFSKLEKGAFTVRQNNNGPTSLFARPASGYIKRKVTSKEIRDVQCLHTLGASLFSLDIRNCACMLSLDIDLPDHIPKIDAEVLVCLTWGRGTFRNVLLIRMEDVEYGGKSSK